MITSLRTEKLTATELAKLIKSGEVGAESYEELWLLLWGFTCKVAYTFYVKNEWRCNQCGIELNDLKQEAYIAMINALNDYPIECEYEFITYYGTHCKRSFYRLAKLTTAAGRNDVGLKAVSLSTPLKEGDSEAIIEEMCVDETAEEAFNEIIERDFQRECTQALDEALKRLPVKHSEFIRYRYYENKTFPELAQLYGCHRSTVVQKQRRILHNLRLNRKLRALYNDITESGYNAVGVNAWKDSKFTSATERTVLNLERAGVLALKA